jgi:hypothetical protein
VVLAVLDLLLISCLFSPIYSSTNLVHATHKLFIEKSVANQQAVQDELQKIAKIEAAIRCALIAVIIVNSFLLFKIWKKSPTQSP